MRQFDVFANPAARSREAVPYVMILQADLIRDTDSVVVTSLVPERRHGQLERLFSIFVLDGRRLMLVMTDLASVPRSMLNRPVANLDGERHRIVAALDLLFTGV